MQRKWPELDIKVKTIISKYPEDAEFNEPPLSTLQACIIARDEILWRDLAYQPKPGGRIKSFLAGTFALGADTNEDKDERAEARYTKVVAVTELSDARIAWLGNLHPIFKIKLELDRCKFKFGVEFDRELSAELTSDKQFEHYFGAASEYFNSENLRDDCCTVVVQFLAKRQDLQLLAGKGDGNSGWSQLIISNQNLRHYILSENDHHHARLMLVTTMQTFQDQLRQAQQHLPVEERPDAINLAKANAFTAMGFCRAFLEECASYKERRMIAAKHGLARLKECVQCENVLRPMMTYESRGQQLFSAKDLVMIAKRMPDFYWCIVDFGFHTAFIEAITSTDMVDIINRYPSDNIIFTILADQNVVNKTTLEFKTKLLLAFEALVVWARQKYQADIPVEVKERLMRVINPFITYFGRQPAKMLCEFLAQRVIGVNTYFAMVNNLSSEQVERIYAYMSEEDIFRDAEPLFAQKTLDAWGKEPDAVVVIEKQCELSPDVLRLMPTQPAMALRQAITRELTDWIVDDDHQYQNVSFTLRILALDRQRLPIMGGAYHSDTLLNVRRMSQGRIDLSQRSLQNFAEFLANDTAKIGAIVVGFSMYGFYTPVAQLYHAGLVSLQSHHSSRLIEFIDHPRFSYAPFKETSNHLMGHLMMMNIPSVHADLARRKELIRKMVMYGYGTALWPLMVDIAKQSSGRFIVGVSMHQLALKVCVLHTGEIIELQNKEGEINKAFKTLLKGKHKPLVQVKKEVQRSSVIRVLQEMEVEVARVEDDVDFVPECFGYALFAELLKMIRDNQPVLGFEAATVRNDCLDLLQQLVGSGQKGQLRWASLVSYPDLTWMLAQNLPKLSSILLSVDYFMELLLANKFEFKHYHLEALLGSFAGGFNIKYLKDERFAPYRKAIAQLIKNNAQQARRRGFETNISTVLAGLYCQPELRAGVFASLDSQSLCSVLNSDNDQVVALFFEEVRRTKPLPARLSQVFSNCFNLITNPAFYVALVQPERWTYFESALNAVSENSFCHALFHYGLANNDAFVMGMLRNKNQPALRRLITSSQFATKLAGSDSLLLQRWDDVVGQSRSGARHFSKKVGALIVENVSTSDASYSQ